MTREQENGRISDCSLQENIPDGGAVVMSALPNDVIGPGDVSVSGPSVVTIIGPRVVGLGSSVVFPTHIEKVSRMTAKGSWLDVLAIFRVKSKWEAGILLQLTVAQLLSRTRGRQRREHAGAFPKKLVYHILI